MYQKILLFLMLSILGIAIDCQILTGRISGQIKTKDGQSFQCRQYFKLSDP